MKTLGQRASILNRYSLVLAALMASALTGSAAAAPRETVVIVPSRAGVTQGFYLIEPEGAPRAIVVMFVGGEGETALNDKGPTKLTGNFLIRVPGPFSRADLILAFPDAPSDQKGRGLGDFRISELFGVIFHVG